MRIASTVLIAPALLAAACTSAVADAGADLSDRTPRAERAYRQLIGDKQQAETTSCINGLQAREQRIIDSRTILFSGGTRGNVVYRSALPANCPRLDRSTFIVRQSPQSRLCSGEIFQVYDSSGTNYGACTFGPFTAYRSR